jgi:predicted dehydrogenase
MEWQLRNWLYFTWLSGDHIVEQHVHNIDVVNWALGATPVRCTAMGGRQVRTDPAYGHIFDHFAVLYEYSGDVFVTSMCRQIEGCAGAVEEGFTGTDGVCVTSPGRGKISGKTAWEFDGPKPNPYEQEQRALIAAIQKNQPLNEGVRIAESTLTAIMGRMSAYTGRVVTWKMAMEESKLDLWPGGAGKMEMGSMPTPEVAVPGKTALV